MEYKIDKGIPIPEIHHWRRAGRPHKYPWDQMEVGDSFLFGASDGKGAHAACVGANNASRGEKHFEARSTPEGFRAWRTK